MRLVAEDELEPEEGDEDLDFAVLAEKELKRRLVSKPSSLPAAFLTKLYAEGRAKAEEPEAILEEADFLAALPALPKSHALDLLRTAIKRQRAVVERYEAEYARIQAAK